MTYTPTQFIKQKRFLTTIERQCYKHLKNQLPKSVDLGPKTIYKMKALNQDYKHFQTVSH